MSSAMLEVTREIKIDHDNVRDLFARFSAATDAAEKAALANTLIYEMAIHGDAEELSVYKDYSLLGLGGSAAHNTEEHAEIKEVIYKASATMDAQTMTRAVTTFITHCKEEEDEQHPIMRQKLSAQDSDKLARAFLKARKMVPTRPDKVVQAVGGRQLAPLKYSHPQI